MDCSPPGSSVHGISQARILEWVTISFYRTGELSKGEIGLDVTALNNECQEEEGEGPAKGKILRES